MQPSKSSITNAPAIYKILQEKFGWEWEPEAGAWVVNDNNCLVFIVDIRETVIATKRPGDFSLGIWSKNKLIPILHWEELEQIVENAGYGLDVWKYGLDIWCEIGNEKMQILREYGETHQEAVEQAILTLGGRR